MNLFLSLSTFILITSCQSFVNSNSTNENLQKMLLETKNPVSDDVLNGMNWDEFKNFYNDWKMVTVTFRTDRDQIRIIYANEIAWRAYEAGGKNFPDGSMFVKTGFSVEEDERFPASKRPSDHLRLLVMKRNHKLYPDTNGWGYAMINRRRLEKLEHGEVPEKYDSITEFQTSCHACHQLAENTDYVFSRPMYSKLLDKTTKGNKLETLYSKFTKTPSLEAAKAMKKILQENRLSTKVLESSWYFEMPLFEGSLPELRAALTNFTKKNNQSYLVYDSKNKLYALSVPEVIKDKCVKAQKYYTGCLDKNIPRANLLEVTQAVTICDGYQLSQ